MATKADEVNDAMVDTYRALREINRKASETPIATRPIVPGAGVDPKRIHKPGKRLRNWHRQSSLVASLKAHARMLSIATDTTTVTNWFANKKAVR